MVCVQIMLEQILQAVLKAMFLFFSAGSAAVVMNASTLEISEGSASIQVCAKIVELPEEGLECDLTVYLRPENDDNGKL